MKQGSLFDFLKPAAAGSSGGGWKWPTDPAERNRLVLALLGEALFIYAYFIQRTCWLGITGSPPASLVTWLIKTWSRGDEYAHGFVVPFIAGGVAYWRWKNSLRVTPMQSSNFGLVVIGVALVMYWVGVRATRPEILAFSMITLIYGGILYLGGWPWAKQLWFPCAFLLFMLPLDFLDQRLAFPLRMFTSKFSVLLLNLFGMEVVQEGTAIKSLNGRFQDLDVANPCSGIRSLMALMALTAVYGYVTLDKGWKKWVLFLSSIPLAVIGNTARIATIAFVAQAFGQKVAAKIYHDFSGFIVFSLATLCMLAISSALTIHYKELLHYWLQDEPPDGPEHSADTQPQ